MLRAPLRPVPTCFEPYFGVLRPVPIVPTSTNVWVANGILWAPVAHLTFMLMSNIPFEVCVVIHIPPHQNDANIRVCGGGLGGWSHEETASRILYTYIYTTITPQFVHPDGEQCLLYYYIHIYSPISGMDHLCCAHIHHNTIVYCNMNIPQIPM